MSAEVVGVKVVRLDPGMPLPSYAHPGDAGADLAIAIDVEIPPGERVLVGTGIAQVEGYVSSGNVMADIVSLIRLYRADP